MIKRIYLLAMSVVAACSSTSPSSNVAKLTVELSLDSARPCSTESPEISVFNVPTGTRTLKVELVDADSMFSTHGGGVFGYNGSPIVPLGALRDYRGPCPVGGRRQIRYEFRVSAIDSKGSVIGFGSVMKSYTAPRILPGLKL